MATVPASRPKASSAKSRNRPHGRASNVVPAGRQASLLWGGLAGGAMIVFAPGGVLLLLALLGPLLLVAMLPEDGRGGQTFKASALLGLAASIHPLLLFWSNGMSLSAAFSLIRQPLIMLTCWAAILLGWFTCEVTSTIARLAADIGATAHRRSLAAALAALEEEWGQLLPPEYRLPDFIPQ